MKIIKNLILVATLISVNGYSQTAPISPLDLINPITTKNIQLKPITKDTVENLNLILKNNDYANFYSVMSSLIKNEEYINFLLSKVNEGHPPIYWLMSDYYSLNNNPRETHKWYYIAIIMTQQDSATCLDLSARFAAQKTIKSFPEVLTTTRQTPQFIQLAMTEVIFFLDNIKQRANPSWACSFGDNDYLYTNEKTIKPYLWPSKREEVLKKFSKSFSK